LIIDLAGGSPKIAASMHGWSCRATAGRICRQHPRPGGEGRHPSRVSKTMDARAGKDATATRSNILSVAIRHFAEKGFDGARVDEIAADTATSKRMIYYYFQDKEDLFIAALEQAYQDIRSVEAGLRLDDLEPEAALAELVGFTFDYQNAHPEFIRLVMIENTHRGRHMAKSKAIGALNVSVVSALERICARGSAMGLFRSGIDAVDLHWAISALCFFNVSNRSTFSLIFDRDLSTPEALVARRAQVVDTILDSVKVRPYCER
jgi:AcrR family transcriptional regulator